jgi:hypothetical protein
MRSKEVLTRVLDEKQVDTPTVVDEMQMKYSPEFCKRSM